ncbi:unnamed protein product [Spirodela intermedia]|uniref:K Homology domain-containing protein n=1 Tax=Spirodela intermedia TaxID=51605 RepID=A0A7I8K8D6_SPIIN|nr:unnamed protein product [Spirodela intermedia]
MFTTTTPFPGAGGGGGGGGSGGSGGSGAGGAYEQPSAGMHPYPVYHLGGVGVEQMNAALLYPYTLYPPLGRMGLGGIGIGGMGGVGGMGLHHQLDVSRKRGRELDHGAGEYRMMEYDESGGLASKRRAAGQDVIFRMIVPSKQIGRVIGKEGCRIRQIREETGATIKIADPIVPHEERVIIISSAVDEGKISNAEAALNYIAKAILKDNEDGGEAVIVGTGHVAVNAIRLLIAGSQAGCLIGVSGQTIEQIRNSSGAAVTILAPNQLPLCASAHESDRVVQLSGDVPEILTALEKIGCVLRDNPSTKVISIRSGYHSSVSVSNPPNTQVPPGEYMTSEMTIMEKFVGGLIGRNGYNISRIRNVSGATVKVTGQKGENTRQIFFGGNAQQVAVARMLVENYMYSQLVPQNVM